MTGVQTCALPIYFTLPIAKQCAHVVGIEGNRQAMMRGQQNARYNNIHNTTFHYADLSKPLEKMPWTQQRYDKILLDPPRSGAKELISQLALFQAKRIVYVSCNPATLARDARELVYEQNYRLIKTGIMDMFPHTTHVETISLFEKR